jgi:hypothetical protein
MKPEFFSSRISVCISLLCGASVLISPRLLGQGAINFNNRAVNANPVAVVAPIYGPDSGSTFIEHHGNATTNGGGVNYTGSLLTGTGFTAQLWAAPQGGILMPLSTTVMRPSGTLAGFVVPPVTAPIIPNAPGGSQVIFELRVWDNRGGTITTWAQVMADINVMRASSGTFATAVAEPPNTPPNLVGLTSFNLFIVPEPGILSLGIVGLVLVAFTWKLRRKPSELQAP